MDNLIIRQVKEKDIERVITMQQQLVNENLIYGFVPPSNEELLNKLGQYFLIAEDSGKVVGFVYGSVHESEGLAVLPKGEKYLEIDDVYVKPDYRDKGIGKALVSKIMDTAKVNGIERFLVYSATKDTDRIKRFYEEVGFRPWIYKCLNKTTANLLDRYFNTFLPLYYRS